MDNSNDRIAVNANDKVLFIPLDGIGDNLMLLHAACRLKTDFPGIQVHFMSNRTNGASDIMQYSPHVNKVIEFQFKGPVYTIKEYIVFFLKRYIPLLLKLKRERYNYIFSIDPNFLIKAVLIFFNKKKKIVRTNKSINQIRNGMDLLRAVRNTVISNIPDGPLLVFDNERSILKKYSLKPGCYILCNFYGSSQGKSFSNYSDVIRGLKEKLNGRHEVAMIGKLKSHEFRGDCIDLVNKTTIEEASVLVKNARLLVTVDGGIMHIGIIQNVPMIAIFKVVHSSYRSPINADYSFFKAIDEKRGHTSFAVQDQNDVIKNNDQVNRGASVIIEEALKYLNIKS